jgi:hypothetical protein
MFSIRRFIEYFDLLNVPEDKVASLFPVGGAAIAPQPKSAVEVDQRRQELINLIDYIKTFESFKYEKIGRDGRNLTLRVRIEVEEMETQSNEFLEKLLCYRVKESK